MLQFGSVRAFFTSCRNEGCLVARRAYARRYTSTRQNGVQDELRVFLLAGEPSGDVIGARLMSALKSLCPVPLKFGGVGGFLMEREGLQSKFLMDELAVMGAIELIPHLLRLKIRLQQTVKAAFEFRPHVVIAIDSKGFSFRLFNHLKAKYAKYQQRCPLHILYVAPTAWAWKNGEERLKKWVSIVDHILCILPFEEPLCEANGLPTTFVGHPVLEDAFYELSKVKQWTSDWHIQGCKERFFSKHSLSQGTTVVSLLPGSRKQEVKRMMPIYKEALEILDLKNFVAVVPTAHTKDLTKLVESFITKWSFPVILLPGASLEQKYDAFAASIAGLCTSGSVVLQMQLARLPCVVAYRANFLTEWLIKRLTKLDYMSVANILLQSPIIPEAVLSNCTADQLAQMLRKLLQDKASREKQILASQRVLSMLVPRQQQIQGIKGSNSNDFLRPSIVAASKVLDLLGLI